LPKILRSKMLGLSATPERKDGLAKVFYWWIGPSLHYEPMKENPKVRVMKYKFTCKDVRFKQYWSWMGFGKRKREPNFTKILENVTNIEERSAFIVERILERLQHNDAQILVLSWRLDHLKSMERLLRKRLHKEIKRLKELEAGIKSIRTPRPIPDGKLQQRAWLAAELERQDEPEELSHENQLFLEQIQKLRRSLQKRITSFYVGGMDADELDKAEEANIIFATYQMAEEGLDIEKLNTVVLSCPKKDIIQSVGRMLRVVTDDPNAPNAIDPMVIDIEDEIETCTRQSEARDKQYIMTRYRIFDYKIKEGKVVGMGQRKNILPAKRNADYSDSGLPKKAKTNVSIEYQILDSDDEDSN
jgi:hypothetical protein